MGFELLVEGIGFSTAHFLIGHRACDRLHGHNYSVRVKLSGELDKEGLVMDFRDLKDSVKKACLKLDHKIVLPGKSGSLKIGVSKKEALVEKNGKKYVFPLEDVVVLPLKSTSCENLARYIHSELKKSLSGRLCVWLEENRGSWAGFCDD